MKPESSSIKSEEVCSGTEAVAVCVFAMLHRMGVATLKAYDACGTFLFDLHQDGAYNFVSKNIPRSCTVCAIEIENGPVVWFEPEGKQVCPGDGVTFVYSPSTS